MLRRKRRSGSKSVVLLCEIICVKLPPVGVALGVVAAVVSVPSSDTSDKCGPPHYAAALG